MTPEHIFYIPTIFFLGFLFGALVLESRYRTKGSHPTFRISGMRLGIAFLVFILVFVATHFFEIPYGSKMVSKELGGVAIFDKKPCFSSEEVYERLRTCSPSGLEAYLHFTYTIDVLFPVTFFYFLFVMAGFVSERRLTKSHWLMLVKGLPVGWLFTDMLENALIFSILVKFPAEDHFIGGVLGYVTVVKFGLLLGSIFLSTSLFAFGKRRIDVPNGHKKR